MERLVINSVDDFLSNVGKHLGTSNWLKISQEIINQYAELTLDKQWIHINPEKVRAHSQYGTTIAHGYYVLSLFTHFLDEIIDVRDAKQVLNYGIDKLTFKAAVPVNSRLRMSVSLKSARDLGSICKATFQCCFEVEGINVPVIEGTIVFLYYFADNPNHINF